MSRSLAELEEEDARLAYEAAVFGRSARQHFISEIEKVAQEGTCTPLMAAAFPHLEKVAAAADSGGDSDETGKMEAQEEGEVDRISPIHDLLGVRAEAKSKGGARGIPVLAPPPGYVYDPILGAMTPKQDDPGWVKPEEAMLQRSEAVGQEKAQQGAMEQAVAQQQQQAAAAGAEAQPGTPGAPTPAAGDDKKPTPPKPTSPSAAGVPQPATPPGIAGRLPR